ncbi:NUDIX hydrolase [Halalkalibacter urbisdiaboli]|uniref:NUDIX hydrolase n=1 Tax=Halalkalibacter urbisdiaboli TaxID=1960589 RepID=UPI000B42FCEE|nr:CoA pyrophosphatase [Halalkalibacter urbisdiaboli]
MEHIFNLLKGREPGILGQSEQRQSAVVLPLVLNNDELGILFEVRSHSLHKQPGEICFPGGRIDAKDGSPQHAAIRELTEEIGIPANALEIVAPLDVLVTPFRGVIYPFVGYIHDLSHLKPNHEEVDHVFIVPLSYLYENKPERYDIQLQFQPSENFPLDVIANKERYSKRVHQIPQYFYYYNDYVIWGLTAQILYHFLELTKPR